MSNISMQAVSALLCDIHLIRVPHPSVKPNKGNMRCSWMVFCVSGYTVWQ